MDNAFDLKVPSVFVISSPFQALCAIAAIKQLEIEDYKIIAFFPKNDPRNSQLKALLDERIAKYKSICTWNRITSRLYVLRSLIHRKSRYKRLFIGDFRYQFPIFIGCNYIEDNASIVHLDDGNISVSLFENTINVPLVGKGKSIFDKVLNRRGLHPFFYFMSIYTGIPNDKFKVFPLNLGLAHGVKTKEENHQDGIIVVGTNSENYCHYLNISLVSFIKEQEEIIAELKSDYPNDKIIYIPHGRDESNYARTICQKYGCEFRKTDNIIELELIRKQHSPKKVVGFTSSALFNIKKMFPDTQVVNILFKGNPENETYKEYQSISEYYKSNGIELCLKELH